MKVFIVDDEQISLFIVRHKMIAEGLAEGKNIHSFLSAGEALEALKACSKEDMPDVLLIDLAMPQMDGWELLEALSPYCSKFEGKCKVYILTSSLGRPDETKAIENPLVSGLIRKPISSDDIMALKASKEEFINRK